MSINDLLTPNNYNIKCSSITATSGHDVNWQTGASAVPTVFIGTGASAGGTASVAIGTNAATGVVANAVAVGSDSVANGAGSVAIGRQATASADFGTAVGYLATAPLIKDISIGSTAGSTNAIGTGVVRLAGIPEPAASTTAADIAIPITINGTAYWLKASTTA